MRVYQTKELGILDLAAKYNYKGYCIFLRKNLSDKLLEDLWEADKLFPNENAAIWLPKKDNHWNFKVCFLRLDKFKTDTISFQQIPDVFNL